MAIPETSFEVDLECPWPGPVPYGEADAEEFLGRSAEVRDLLDLIERQRLNVLIALSGVGKSSLLQAGLIPALRYMREETGEIGPVLLAREWARLRETSPATLLAQAIRRAIEALHSRDRPMDGPQLKEDAERLYAVQFPEGEDSQGPEAALRALLDYVRRLCDVTGELVLILDQAEELLGSGLFSPDQGVQFGVLRVIGILFEKEKRLRLFLSLREEYLGRISGLARDVEGLEKRVFRLNPMPRDTVKDILGRAAEITASRVAFENDATIETLLGWLGESPSAAVTDDQAPVDLLRLQALLINIFLHARKELQSETIVIGDRLLGHFKEELTQDLRRENPNKSISDVELARRALEMYIERLLRSADLDESLVGPQYALVKRVLIRMAPWLSSPGGFKRHIAAEDLIYNAIRDDLDALNLTDKPEDVRAAIREFFLSLEAQKEKQRRRYHGLRLDIHFERLDTSCLSGEALMHSPPWSLEQVATMLTRAAIEVLDLLCEKYVLKASQGRMTVTYELVHDGFGPALFEWAERERLKLTDTLASIVSRRGETFRWPGVQDTILKRVSWLGCSLNEKTFERVTFAGAVLTGSVFLQCIFRNCVFDHCDLRGTVFLGGSWENVQILSCVGASALVRGTEWSVVSIRSSIFDNSTLADLGLLGKVVIDDSSLQFAQIQKFRVGPEAPSLKILGCDLQNALIEERRAELNEECNKTGVLTKRSEPVAPRRDSPAGGAA